jgi:hypothetical protein
MSHQCATLSNGESRTLITSRVRSLAIIGLTLAMIVVMALVPYESKLDPSDETNTKTMSALVIAASVALAFRQ